VIQRRAIIGVVLAAAIPVLSSCGLEVKDETSRESSPVQAADISVGAIDVRDAFVTYDPQGGIQPLASNPPGVPGAGSVGQGYLVVTLVNNGTKPDEFTGATSPLGTITMSGNPQQTAPANASAGVLLRPGVPVTFGSPALGGTGATLQIAAGGTPATTGTSVRVQFSFTNAGSSTASVPVVASQDVTVGPTQVIPTPTATQTLPTEGLKPADD
jgi:copper(I)-binding protein